MSILNYSCIIYSFNDNVDTIQISMFNSLKKRLLWELGDVKPCHRSGLDQMVENDLKGVKYPLKITQGILKVSPTSNCLVDM